MSEGELSFSWGKVRVRLRGARVQQRTIRLVGQLEVGIGELFERAVDIAESPDGLSLEGEAWNGLKELLPMLVEAQSVLLETEVKRCRAIAERRGGRPCAVRFKCFDMSAMDPPAAYYPGSHKTEEEMLRVLLPLMTAQRRWVAQTPVRKRSRLTRPT